MGGRLVGSLVVLAACYTSVMRFGVITKVADPASGGNLATAMGQVFLDPQAKGGDYGDPHLEFTEALGLDPMLGLYMQVPVFTVGELLVLDGNDRDQMGRKPSKWSVTCEEFDDIERYAKGPSSTRSINGGRRTMAKPKATPKLKHTQYTKAGEPKMGSPIEVQLADGETWERAQVIGYGMGAGKYASMRMMTLVEWSDGTRQQLMPWQNVIWRPVDG